MQVLCVFGSGGQMKSWAKEEIPKSGSVKLIIEDFRRQVPDFSKKGAFLCNLIITVYNE